MSRRSRTRLNFVISAVFLLFLSALGFAWIAHRYPWPIPLNDYSLARPSPFITYWPMTALDEDRQERKKLKRFPRSEQQRRLGVIMRRMDYLTVPLFDFFMDSGLQFFGPEVPAGVSPASTLIWPTLPTARNLGTNDSGFRDVRYVVLPNSSGAQCLEGISLYAGEELRVNLPISRNKRNVTFGVVPLAPSNLRAWLGQFSWARQFSDVDVNRLQSVTIPVNDSTASLLRLSLGSGEVLLTSASLSQWERSGRFPVQAGKQSKVWKSANASSLLASESDGAALEPVAEEGTGADEATNPSEASKVAAPSQPSENRAVRAAPGDSAKMPLNAESSNANSAGGFANGRKANEADASKNAKTKTEIQSMEELLDPASVKFNPVMSVPGEKSVAIGYNVLFIQLDPLLSRILSDERLSPALTPHLHAFKRDALLMPLSDPLNSKSSELFQQTIVRQFGEPMPVGLPILMKDLVSGRRVFNLYQEFRNFGYKSVSFAPPAALSLPDALSSAHLVGKMDGRWLDGNDWSFLSRRKELDQQNEPASGLEAIFKSEKGMNTSAMTEGDFSRLGDLLEGLERSSDSVPDWRANEMSVVSSRDAYLPRLLDSFQRWIKENSQARFFGHMYMVNDDLALRPTFKDFLKVLRHNKFNAIASPRLTEKYARVVMLDRVFGTVLDTLVARRIHHRTVVAALLPGTKNDGSVSTSEGQFLLSIPSLIGRRPPKEQKFLLDDALATMAQSVGVQLAQHDSQGQLVFKGVGLGADKAPTSIAPVSPVEIQQKAESKATVEIKSKSVLSEEKLSSEVGQTLSSQQESAPEEKPSQVSRFRMLVMPRAAGCQPFEWWTSSSYFGLVSSQPIVEEPSPRGRVIRVFPCGLRDQVIELSWFQNHDGLDETGASATNVSRWLGGTLQLNATGFSTENQDSPSFLIGPQALSLDSLPLKLVHFQSSEVNKIFEIEFRREMERESLARILNLNTQMQTPHLAARTLVYFFREPIRR